MPCAGHLEAGQSWRWHRPGLEGQLVPEDLGAYLVARQDPEGGSGTQSSTPCSTMAVLELSLASVRHEDPWMTRPKTWH